jgi:asparagine synthase (glutamine-hydrolysing)
MARCTTTGIAVVAMPGQAMDRRAMRRMLHRMMHRGPDTSAVCTRVDAGSFIELGCVGIVHEPNDLSDSVPFDDTGVGFASVIDGVITNIDRLVIRLEECGVSVKGKDPGRVIRHAVAHWGEAAFGLMDGHYAVVCYDPRRRRLLLARDALGVRPLYWAICRDSGGAVIASELRAILASGQVSPAYDSRGIASYLAYGHSHAPSTVLQDVWEVPAGSWLEIQFDGSRFNPQAPVRHWFAPEGPPPPVGDDVTDLIGEVLCSSVADLAKVAPRASCYLPGDVESALLAFLANRHLRKLETVFVDLESEGQTERARLAAAVAEDLNSRHHQMIIDEEWGRTLWREWLTAADNPYFEGYDSYVICQAIKNTGAGSAMLPTGGAELFRGHPIFAITTRLLEMASWVKRSPRWLRAAVRTRMVHSSSPMYRGLIEDACVEDATTMTVALNAQRVFRNKDLEQLGFSAARMGLNAAFLPPTMSDFVPEPSGDIFADLIKLHVHASFPYGSMRANDLGGMANSLHCVLPYASRPVAECLMTLSGSVVSPKPSRSGAAIHAVASTMLPYNLLMRHEPHPRFPFHAWMKGPLRGLLDDCVAAVASCSAVDGEALLRQWGRIIEDPHGAETGKAMAVIALGACMRQFSAASAG